MAETSEPVGIVRFEREGTGATVSVAVHPDHWGKGYATDMLTKSTPQVHERWAVPIYAHIKLNNVASVRAFHNAGYHFWHAEQRADTSDLVYRFPGTC